MDAPEISRHASPGSAANSLIVVHDAVVEPAAHVLYVFSEVDISTAPEFDAEVGKAADDGLVVVELSDCRYMDTSGISVLTRAYRRLGSRLRIVVTPNSHVERVLRLLRLQSLLRICTGLDEVLGATASGRAS